MSLHGKQTEMSVLDKLQPYMCQSVKQALEELGLLKELDLVEELDLTEDDVTLRLFGFELRRVRRITRSRRRRWRRWLPLFVLAVVIASGLRIWL